jgi:hypothetical protein
VQHQPILQLIIVQVGMMEGDYRVAWLICSFNADAEGGRIHTCIQFELANVSLLNVDQ